MGLLDYADAAGRKFFGLLSQAPDNAKQMALAAYQLATDQNARQAAMSRLPKAFDESKSGRQMFDEAMNVGPSGLLGKIVWHGSPHKFDKFDASKIGTGGGAQAYGHGLYLADAPAVADSYAGMRPMHGKFSLNGKPWDAQTYAESMAESRLRAGKGYDLTIANIEKEIESAIASRNPEDATMAIEIRDALKSMQSKGVEVNAGSLYKADLPDEWIPKMLDWDKPLKQQPESAQKIIVEQLRQSKPELFAKWSENGALEHAPLGSWIQELAPNTQGGGATRAELSNALRASGIPGIRYLDGGSRSAGQGSYNYVVFPGLEDQIKILERNGIPLQGLLK